MKHQCMYTVVHTLVLHDVQGLRESREKYAYNVLYMHMLMRDADMLDICTRTCTVIPRVPKC